MYSLKGKVLEPGTSRVRLSARSSSVCLISLSLIYRNRPWSLVSSFDHRPLFFLAFLSLPSSGQCGNQVRIGGGQLVCRVYVSKFCDPWRTKNT